jgi:hypothetical protein
VRSTRSQRQPVAAAPAPARASMQQRGPYSAKEGTVNGPMSGAQLRDFLTDVPDHAHVQISRNVSALTGEARTSLYAEWGTPA